MPDSAADEAESERLSTKQILVFVIVLAFLFIVFMIIVSYNNRITGGP